MSSMPLPSPPSLTLTETPSGDTEAISDGHKNFEASKLRPHTEPRELTARGFVLGAVITAIFMSANIYMGLKTGMTFSTSIPAAMLSMGCLRLITSCGSSANKASKNEEAIDEVCPEGGVKVTPVVVEEDTILESNIIQTQASAAGTLCNVILALPGMVLIGYWQGFPLWQTTLLCLLGGWLGVAFSIPLRRFFLYQPDLLYPEGVAAAEVLRSGQAENAAGLKCLLLASLFSGTVSMATDGLKVLAVGATVAFRIHKALFSMGTNFSLALVGLGYLVGVGPCIAIFTGVMLAWIVAVPILSSSLTTPIDFSDSVTAADFVWSNNVRLIGGGVIAAGGVYTVLSLCYPLLRTLYRQKCRRVPSVPRGMSSASRGDGLSSGSFRRMDTPAYDKDVPLRFVIPFIVALIAALGAYLSWFAVDGASGMSGANVAAISILATIVAAVLGFVMSTICGYLAGLLGSSTSPISGIGILTIMATCLLFPLCFPESSQPTMLASTLGPSDEISQYRINIANPTSKFLMAFAVLVTSIIITASSIANDNYQDLKTGIILGATPWRQQVALLTGVAIGSIAISLSLFLLYTTYGFKGVPFPREGMDETKALAVPTAALITDIAVGIVLKTLEWRLIAIGVVLGVLIICVEAFVRRKYDFIFPTLSVGIGMYLPHRIEIPIALGGLISYLTTISYCKVYYAKNVTGEGTLQQSHKRNSKAAVTPTAADDIGTPATQISEAALRGQQTAAMTNSGLKNRSSSNNSDAMFAAEGGSNSLAMVVSDNRPEVAEAVVALDARRQRGSLIAAGLVVGESFIGVVIAALDAILTESNSTLSIAVRGGWIKVITWIGFVVFIAGLFTFYWQVARVNMQTYRKDKNSSFAVGKSHRLKSIPELVETSIVPQIPIGVASGEKILRQDTEKLKTKRVAASARRRSITTSSG